MNIIKKIFKTTEILLLVVFLMSVVTKNTNAATCLPMVTYNTQTKTCNPTSQIFDSTSKIQCGGTKTCEGLYGVGNCYSNTSACLQAHPAPASCLPKVFFDIVATNTATGYNSGTCKPTVANFNTSTGLVCNPTSATNGLNCNQYLYTLGLEKGGNGCYSSSVDCVTPAYAGGVKPDFRWIYNSSVKKCVQTNHRYSNNTSNGTYDRDVDDPTPTLCSENAKAPCYKSLAECSSAQKCSPRYFCNTSYTCESSANNISISATNHNYNDLTEIDCGSVDTGLNSTGLSCYQNIHDPRWTTNAMPGAQCYKSLLDCQATCKKPVLPTPPSTSTSTPTSVPSIIPGLNTCSKSFIIKLATMTPASTSFPTPVGTSLSTPRTTPVAVTPTATPIIISCDKNLDISLVLDRSASMNDIVDGKAKLEWAKDAAKGLVNALINVNATKVKVGVVSFGSQGNDGTGSLTPDFNSSIDSPLSNSFLSANTAIGNIINKKWGTCIECGLKLANSQLTSPINKKVAVLISDGMANHNWNGSTTNAIGNAISMANTGKASGIEYRTIGYGLKETGQIDESTLINVASNPMYYQYRPNVTDWASSFIGILKDLCLGTSAPSPVATITVTDDASVYASTPSNNYGNDTVLKTDGSPVSYSYLKLNLSTLGGKTVKKAFLKLNTTSAVYDDLMNINSTSATWTESTLNYNNKPVMGPTVTSFKTGQAGYVTYVDVTDFVNSNKGNTVSIALSTFSSNGYYFSSSEAAVKPTLVIY